MEKQAALEAWRDFFVAQVGASAALVGLLFVALSINVTQILKYHWLPARAALTLVVLTGALFEASLQLMPAAAAKPLCVITTLISLGTWLGSMRLVGLDASPDGTVARGWLRFHAASTQLATLPALIGSGFLLAGSEHGYYFLAAGILLTLAFALFNTWVLMIEILR